MNRALFVLILAGGAFLASASQLTPSATVTLDNGSPAKDGSDWDWTYTISVINGDLNSVRSFEIFDVYGVVGTSAPWWDGWGSNYNSVGGGLYDVTFTNFTDPCSDCTLDGFKIESISGIKANSNYSVDINCDNHDSGGVGVAKAATPEPVSVSLICLPLLALAGLKFRRNAVDNVR